MPLIVQGDRTVLLETDHPRFREVRDRLAAFAEIEKSPERVHVYRITPISLWNAAASGIRPAEVIDFLRASSRYPVPRALLAEIEEFMGRYGELRLVAGEDGGLELHSAREENLARLAAVKHVAAGFADPRPRAVADGHAVRVRPEWRGELKTALIKLGYPVEDLAGYRRGAPLNIALSTRVRGRPFTLRPYQVEAVEAFHAGGAAAGGNGVICLPCGAGKTVVAIGVLEKVRAQALILSTNITALRQWRRELLEKTTLSEDEIGEYSGEKKEIRPVTLTTYQILTYRKSRSGEFLHFHLFRARDWGIVVYDEVHLLPAPVFRFTAEIQATRRLGLTATLIREDGLEDEVFSLIGPRRYDVPWRALENEGWIATARCVEVRVEMPPELAGAYAAAERRDRFRLASENARKVEVVREIVARHHGDRVLIIGQYLDQLRILRRELGAPIITGKTPAAEREGLYQAFRTGAAPVLIVSKVGNFAVDLPEANVAVQVSGTFGSRQEEAQRLGRILRPKPDGGKAVFYSVVTGKSREQEFAEKRQLFLTEQGYGYAIEEAAAARRARGRPRAFSRGWA